MNIVAIDPGASNTGLVHMSETYIIDVKTIACRAPLRGDNEALAHRCRSIWNQVENFLDSHPHDAVVIEGFQVYRGMGKSSASHQTPWLCGVLIDRMEERGEDVHIQMSGQVLRENAKCSSFPDLERMRHGKRVFGDQDKLSNEHLRSAFAHGLYFLRRGK